MKRFFLILIGFLGSLVVALSVWPAPAPVAHSYFEGVPEGKVEVIAHGGGQGHAPPNTIRALKTAKAMGADVLEVDVQRTRDGVMILRHDDTLDRTTDFTGAIADYDWNDLEGADAGARTIINGKSFAGQGITIPRLDEALAAFPQDRWILEIKNNTAEAAEGMCTVIRETGMEERVLVGSFHDEAMVHFRAACPQVATSTASGEAQTFILAARLGLSRFVKTPAVAMQLPPSAGRFDLAHPRVFAAARGRGIRLQYWTINEPQEMEGLVDVGADGLITDYVDRARAAVAKTD